jgi:hypothetical protein
MGVLGLSPQSTNETLAGAQPAREFPAGFAESFDATWQEGRLFSQSISHANARSAALDDYIDQVRQAGGNIDAELAKQININGEYNDFDKLGAANTALATAKEKNAGIKLEPMTEDNLEQAAIAKSRAALEKQRQIELRGMTGYGRLGAVLGGLSAAAADPINIIGLAVAPAEGLGVLATALRWGAIAGVNQAAIEATASPYHEAVVPGYGAGPEPARAIVESAVTGGIGGGGLKLLGNVWSRVASGVWPRSVRDAGNTVASEAHTQSTNVFMGAEGEAAHWDAMNFSIDAILNAKPVNVEHIVTPDILERTRSLVAGLEAERRMAMPIFDERSIRLTSEEAGLRSQDTTLSDELGRMPAGDIAAADRLNRLQAVDEQLSRTTDLVERRALQQRRDQILVDTSPEELQRQAGPIEQRRVAETRRNQIAARLTDIEKEREQIAMENLGAKQPMLMGQTEPARLNSTIQQIAEVGGHIIDQDEASAIAEKIGRLEPDRLADAEKMIQVAPHQVAQGYQTFIDHDAIPRSNPAVDRMLQEAVSTPEMQTALRADLDRERMLGDVQVHMGTEDELKPQSLDSLLNDIDNQRAAADQIEACANPAPEKTAEAEKA